MEESLINSLYGDIVEVGGLGDAVRREAATLGIEFGRMLGSQWSTTTILTDNGNISVIVGASRRVFLLTVRVATREWASGGTTELADVVRVADAWRRGITLDELHERFPFMTFTRLARAYEQGNQIEVRWVDVLEAPYCEEIQPTLLAARADERLGRMFPSVTHRTLARFAVDDDDRGAGEVRIELLLDGRFKVDASWVDVPQVVDSVDRAVRVAAAQLDHRPGA
jgi:hypothetical protein